MPNNDLWLRKIAAFLHDPPYKVWFFKKKYHGQKWARDKDVIELYENCITPAYPFKDPQNPEKIKFRKFHHIAVSAGKNNYFGFAGGNIVFGEKGYKFVHSLSGEIISLYEFWETIPDLSFDPKDEVENFLKNLTGNEKNKFLALWRTLPISITVWVNLFPIDTKVPDNITRDLDVIQSALITTWDERTPLNDPKSLHPSFLILEFGPVQKFIANARKTRDLWFSSWLISYLAWQAMKPIADKLGPDNILYPDLYKQPLVDDWLEKENVIKKNDWERDKLRLPTLPNTFLAIVKEGNEKCFYEKAFTSLKKAWKKITQDVCRLLNNTSPAKEEFDRQTQQIPFDVYWLGLKWGQNPDEAIKDYKNLLNPPNCWQFDKLWEHIKNKVRNPNIGDTYALLVEMASTGLKAVKYRGKLKVANEPGHKCSLCGERTALTDGDPDDLGSIKKFWNRMANAFPGHIKENEYLCAVCLVKRLAPKVIYQSTQKGNISPYFESEVEEFDFHYPSTGSIALAPFIKKMIEDKIDFSPIEKAIERLLRNTSDKEKRKNFLDGHFTEGRTVSGIKERLISENIAGKHFAGDFEPEWFYDESFPRFYEELKAKGYEDKIELAKEIEKAVAQIKEEAKKKGADYHLSKYYAAVYLDGDHLGKWLRGDNAPKIESVFHPDFVKELSNDPHFKSIKDLKRPVTPAIHRAISGALRDFALEVVPYVVEDNLGVVVYSGGDDTLFLMPLENLFNTLIALHKLYSGDQFDGEFSGRKYDSGQGFIKIYKKNYKNDEIVDELREIIRVMGTKATLSAGVAIAHYLDPLDITLRKAQKALQDAKDKGRNRAGFYLILHSGSERKTVVPWSFVEMMERFKTRVANGFSSRFLRTLYQEVEVYQRIPDAFEAEFLRLGSRGQGENAKSLLCDLLEVRKRTGLNPKEFLEALLIADFVVREEGAK